MNKKKFKKVFNTEQIFLITFLSGFILLGVIHLIFEFVLPSVPSIVAFCLGTIFGFILTITIVVLEHQFKIIFGGFENE